MKVPVKVFCSFLILLVMMVTSTAVFATHNRAGEITYEHVPNTVNTYRVKIVTYTKLPGNGVPDRPELEIFWGDGESDTIPRVLSVIVGPDVKRNEYYGEHNYFSAGVYILSFLDENRNAFVNNIPNSVNVPFYVQTQLIINPTLNLLGLFNNSPVLLEPPIDDGVLNQVFIHNPGAYDPDGDSLSYELSVCRGANGQPISNYTLPIGAGSNISVNPVTGDFIWDVPKLSGLFNFAIIIREWKEVPGIGKINISYVTRDFQVNITTINNLPPQITAKDTCVEAGNLLAFNVMATEPDGEPVTVTATGSPFQLSNSPAVHDTTNTTGNDTAIYNFIWYTNCDHIRRNPYQVVFKAVDDNPQNIQLSDIETINITIIGPAPKNPEATAQGNAINLHWNPSTCSNASGYNIYRRVNPANYTPDYCVTGVPAQTGYVLIGNTNNINDTTFSDDNNGQGLANAVQYCYMITARFPDGAEGYPSVEVCAVLNRDLPVITNADVVTTDATTGTVYIAWAPPTDLDTIQFPGPYSYIVQRSVSGGPFTDLVTLTNWNDTIYTDINIDTKNNQYVYCIQFNYNGGTFLGKSQNASTTFLTASPGDNKVRLSWELNVPWTNSMYYIYRRDQSNPYSLIDSSTTSNYTDYNALNTVEYCYYISGFGGYADPAISFPLINRSQEACAVPVDNEPPCPPVIGASAQCDSSSINFNISYGNVVDCIISDIDYFTVYYRASETEEFDSIGYFRTNDQTYQFERSLYIGGCYYITATDTNGNTTDSSNSVCIESCPLYELPDLFTPDGNGQNDLFTPIEDILTGLFFRDIESVDMKIYNRWGSVVFETTDPVIRWNGKRNNDGEDVPEGVYFYTCTVNVTKGNTPVEPLKLKGTVTVSRGANVK